MVDNNVEFIQEDAEGWLWILNQPKDRNINNFSNISFVNIYTEQVQRFEERFKNNNVLKIENVYSVISSPDKHIYIGTMNGQVVKYHFSTGFEVIYKQEKSRILLDKVTTQSSIFGKTILKTGEEHYFEIDTLGKPKWTYEHAENYQYIDESKNGTHWFLHCIPDTKDSIKLYTLSKDFEFKQFVKSSRKKLKNWRSSYFYGDLNYDGNFWFTGMNTLIVFDPEQGDIFDFSVNYPVMCENSIDEVFFDNRKNAWITTENGIYKVQLNSNPFKNYLSKYKEDLAITEGTSCRGLHAQNGQLWVTTIFDQQYQIDTKTDRITPSTLPLVQLPNGSFEGKVLLNVASFKEEEIIFAGALDVTYDLTNQTPHIIPRQTGHATHTWVWFKSNDGTMYAGLENDGIGYWDQQKDSVLFFNQYNEFETLRKSTVYAFLQLDENHILVGSTSGIYLLHTSKGIIHRYWTGGEEGAYFSFDAIFHFYKDKKNKNIIWVGTGGGGLVRWDTQIGGGTKKEQLLISGTRDNQIQFSNADGLSSNVIYAIYEDDHDNLWLPSDYGIIRFHKMSHNAKAFLQKDGITHHEFNRMSHAQDEEGNMFFGGLNGVTAFHPDDLTENETLFDAPMEVLNLQQFDGKTNKLQDRTSELIKNGTITLNPGDQFFRLDFALLNYQDATQVRYSYKIDGQDKDWVLIKENQLRISGLPYGNFKLRIRGQGVSGEFSVNELTIPIIVQQPIYLRSWFQISALFFLFLGIYFFNNWRIKNLKARQKELEESIKEATKTIRHQNESLKKDNQTIEEQAEELRKMDEMKSRFFANVSHELRTPLTLLLAPIQSVLNNNRLNNRDFSHLLMAKKNGAKLNKMINEILDLTKLEAGKLEIHLDHVVWFNFLRKSVADFESFANQKNINFTFQYEGNQYLQIELDRQKMDIILMNLLSNAFKFTPKNGRVTLKARNEGQFLFLKLSDSGRGIHPEDLPYVFNRFYQSNRKTWLQKVALELVWL